VSASRPARTLPPGKTRYPLYRRLGEPQGRSGQVRKISPPPGFDPRTVQPVANRYTDYATRPTFIDFIYVFFCSIRFTLTEGRQKNSNGPPAARWPPVCDARCEQCSSVFRYVTYQKEATIIRRLKCVVSAFVTTVTIRRILCTFEGHS
jgi:hypothetical protein